MSRSSISEEDDEPVMNVTLDGEEPQNGNGSGPLSWIGTVLALLYDLAPIWSVPVDASCMARAPVARAAAS